MPTDAHNWPCPSPRVQAALGLTLMAASLALHLQAGLGDTAIPSGWLDGRVVSVRGVVVERRCAPRGCRLSLEDPRVGERSLGRRITLHLDRASLSDESHVGHAIRVAARLMSSRGRHNPNPFLEPARRHRLFALATAAPTRVDDGHIGWAAGLRLTLRRGIAHLGPGSEGLYSALLLGERGTLPVDVRWAFQDTGTAHLLAISGLHLALIGLGLYRVLLWGLIALCRRRAQLWRMPAVAGALALVVLWGYGSVIAPSSATQRALVFMTLLFGGALLGRRATPTRTLAVAAFVAVVIDPLVVTGPSFQLSFAAAAALIGAAPRLSRLRARLEEAMALRHPVLRRLAVWAALLAGVNVVAFAATAPLGAAWFGQLAPAAVVANLVAVPMVTLVVLPLGFIWAGLVICATPVAEALVPVVDGAGAALLWLVGELAALAGPSSTAAWPVTAGVLVSLGVIVHLGDRPSRRVLATGLVAVGAVWAALAHAPNGRLQVTAFDVGHGDALLVRAPDGATMLVDAGGSWRGPASNQRLVDRHLAPGLTRLGAARLNALVISHIDHDHIGGALDVARRFAVDELWIPPCGAASDLMGRLTRAVVARGGVVRVVTRGAPFTWGGVEVQALWPTPDVVRADGRCRVGINDGSLTLALRHAGRTVLLTGDIEARAEAALTSRFGGALKADVLKAPHHGSRSSSTPEFLRLVQPEHVIVSGVRGRGAMPPHQQVLDRYRAHGAQVWVTGDEGAVTTSIEGNGRLTVSGSRLRPP